MPELLGANQEGSAAPCSCGRLSRFRVLVADLDGTVVTSTECCADCVPNGLRTEVQAVRCITCGAQAEEGAAGWSTISAAWCCPICVAEHGIDGSSTRCASCGQPSWLTCSPRRDVCLLCGHALVGDRRVAVQT